MNGAHEPPTAVLPPGFAKPEPPAPQAPNVPQVPAGDKGPNGVTGPDGVRETQDSVRGQLMDKLDRHLDQDEEDKKTMDRLKNPFVRWIVGSLVALLFLVFFTYFLSFYLQIPLPESELLKHLMNVILEIMKILVPPT